MEKYNKTIALFMATIAMYFSTEIFAVALVGGLPINAGIGSNGFYFGIGDGAAGGIANALCNIAGWFQGGVGQAIASLAIIFLGISAFFGKVTWGTALLFAVGVFSIFGSADIVKAIIAGTNSGEGFSFGLDPGGGWNIGYSSGTSCGGF
jgi:type IV secretory pathway VirB2 component (pilin)